VHLEQTTLESCDNLDRIPTPGWLRRRCQVDADAAKGEGAGTGGEGAGCEGRRIV
jgi:hypothetical protein